MAVAPKHLTFRSWLVSEIDRQGIARREVARRLALRHPKGASPETIETYRRAIYRYLDPTSPMIPNAQTRRAFAVALGVRPDEVPASDAEEDEPDLAVALQTLARERPALARQLTRALKVKQ